MNTLSYVLMVLLVLGGVLALSNVIVAKKPDAQQMIDKLMPYQALIGVGLLVVALVFWLKIGLIDLFRLLKFDALLGAIFIGGVFSGILLGFFFGMPQIAKWAPGESSAEAKALELSRKLAPYTMLVGAVAIGAAVLMLLARLGLLKYLH